MPVGLDTEFLCQWIHKIVCIFQVRAVRIVLLKIHAKFSSFYLRNNKILDFDNLNNLNNFSNSCLGWSFAHFLISSRTKLLILFWKWIVCLVRVCENFWQFGTAETVYFVETIWKMWDINWAAFEHSGGGICTVATWH